MTARTLQPRERVAFLGKTGCGKSYACGQLLRSLTNPRVLAFDPHDELSAAGRKSREVTLGPLRQRVTFEELAADPLRYLGAESVSLSVVPSADRSQDFRELLRFVKHAGDLVLVCEEVGRYTDCIDELEELACEFRHYGVAVVFSSQRAVHIPKDARTQLSEIWSGRQDDPEDLDALARRCGRPFADAVAKLPPRKLEHWKDEWVNA